MVLGATGQHPWPLLRNVDAWPARLAARAATEKVLLTASLTEKEEEVGHIGQDLSGSGTGFEQDLASWTSGKALKHLESRWPGRARSGRYGPGRTLMEDHQVPNTCYAHLGIPRGSCAFKIWLLPRAQEAVSSPLYCRIMCFSPGILPLVNWKDPPKKPGLSAYNSRSVGPSRIVSICLPGLRFSLPFTT